MSSAILPLEQSPPVPPPTPTESKFSPYFTAAAVVGSVLLTAAAFTATGAVILKVTGVALLAFGIAGVAAGVIPALADKVYTLITGKESSSGDDLVSPLCKTAIGVTAMVLTAGFFAPIVNVFIYQFIRTIYPWIWWF